MFAERAGESGDRALGGAVIEQPLRPLIHRHAGAIDDRRPFFEVRQRRLHEIEHAEDVGREGSLQLVLVDVANRSEEHTSELQSLMRISYAVFCLKKKKHNKLNTSNNT